ncbi:MAG: hypothetical protein WBK76_04205, partial [Candidatus Saccharimonadales bacterium]
VRQRSNQASLKSDLANAVKQMEIAKVNTGTTSYATSLPAEIKTTAGNVLQLTSVSDATTFCLNAYGKDGFTMSYHSRNGTNNYLCSGALIGSPAGGSTPAVPKNTNLVSGFANWTTSGVMSFNSASNEMVCGSGIGSAISPLVRVDGAPSTRLQAESYSTAASPSFTPNGGILANSAYYAADGTTPAQSASTPSYAGNGNAQPATLNTWVPYIWDITTGPQVIYVRYQLQCSPSDYTSNGLRLRNPAIIAL